MQDARNVTQAKPKVGGAVHYAPDRHNFTN